MLLKLMKLCFNNGEQAKYIGSIATKEIRGEDNVQKCYTALKKKNQIPEPVVIIVSPDGVRTIEGLTGVVKQSIFIEHVTFTTTLGEKREIFAFISHDTRLQRISCHIYMCGDGVAFEITCKINDAFQVLKKKKAEGGDNTFAAAFGDREVVPGRLFTRQVHRADVKPDRVIGAGQFGEVYLAQFQNQVKHVAVKTVRLAASEDDKGDFIMEAEVMLKLQHENLVNILGVAMQQRPWLCVIEFMEYGDLRDVVQTCKEKGFELSYWEQLLVIKQIAAGLGYIASRRFIHMDIAARNVLLDKGNCVKVADFGLTRRLDRGRDTYALRKTAKLPVRWLAVEAIETGVFSEKSDVWAFGVLIWEVLRYAKTSLPRPTHPRCNWPAPTAIINLGGLTARCQHCNTQISVIILPLLPKSRRVHWHILPWHFALQPSQRGMWVVCALSMCVLCVPVMGSSRSRMLPTWKCSVIFLAVAALVNHQSAHPSCLR